MNFAPWIGSLPGRRNIASSTCFCGACTEEATGLLGPHFRPCPGLPPRDPRRVPFRAAPAPERTGGSCRRASVTRAISTAWAHSWFDIPSAIYIPLRVTSFSLFASVTCGGLVPGGGGLASMARDVRYQDGGRCRPPRKKNRRQSGCLARPGPYGTGILVCRQVGCTVSEDHGLEPRLDIFRIRRGDLFCLRLLVWPHHGKSLKSAVAGLRMLHRVKAPLGLPFDPPARQTHKQKRRPRAPLS